MIYANSHQIVMIINAKRLHILKRLTIENNDCSDQPHFAQLHITQTIDPIVLNKGFMPELSL